MSAIHPSRAPLRREGFNSLGILVDRLTLSGAVDRILEMVDQGREDCVARLVATLNVNLLVNALGYSHARPRNPELLEILRSADLVTADGFPIVLLSRIMGAPVPGRVTGSDLVPALAARAARSGASIYLLGGVPGSAEEAAERLASHNPGLRIAGTSSPTVHTEGAGIALSAIRDKDLVEAINATGADILLIGFGNPKQEQWWYRNRKRLRVPVAIGIGGTFEFIAGRTKRAPKRIQRLNLEWVYRITQDPKRLWKRYSVGLVKLAALTTPVLIQRLQENLRRPFMGPAGRITSNILRTASGEDIRTAALPRWVTAECLEQLISEIEGEGRGQVTLIDMARVRQVELAASHILFKLSRAFDSGQLRGALIDVPARVARQFEACRILDACTPVSHELQHYEIGSGGLRDAEQARIEPFVLANATVVYLGGHLDGEAIDALDLDAQLTALAKPHGCVVDLRHARSIESVGLARLSLIAGHADISLSGVSPAVRAQIERAELGGEFRIVPDQDLRSLLFAGL